MMDAEIVGIPGGGSSLPQMDLFVPSAATGSHAVPIVTGQAEEEQQAQVLCQQVLGSIPQVPSGGVDWPSYLAGQISPAAFGALDASIRANLSAGGRDDYRPVYDIVNDALSVAAVKQTPLTIQTGGS